MTLRCEPEVELDLGFQPEVTSPSRSAVPASLALRIATVFFDRSANGLSAAAHNTAATVAAPLGSTTCFASENSHSAARAICASSTVTTLSTNACTCANV